MSNGLDEHQIPDDSKSRWEERAADKGATLQGVLYRGFSEELNQYIHDWHVWAVTSQLLPRIRANAVVLDMACGYGRIRKHIIDARPDLRVIGTDFSESYCRMHAHTFHAETVCSDIRCLPFAPGTFDAIVGVTALMYLPPLQRPALIRQVLNVLKPSGHALFIDPGLEFMRLARFGVRSTRTTPTGGEGFSLNDYRRLDAAGTFKTIDVGGIPFFTALLPLLYLIRRNPKATSALLKNLRSRDFSTRLLLRYALQRWVLLGPQ